MPRHIIAVQNLESTIDGKRSGVRKEQCKQRGMGVIFQKEQSIQSKEGEERERQNEMLSSREGQKLLLLVYACMHVHTQPCIIIVVTVI